ncbi:cadherin-like beta sandwich domain-containing protein [Paenibacillus sp. GCM10012307]
MSFLIFWSLLTAAFPQSISAATDASAMAAPLEVGGALSGLSIKGAKLEPGFAAEVHNYEVQVPINTTKITVTPTAIDANARISVSVGGGEAQTVPSGARSLQIALQGDRTLIQIKVEPAADAGETNTTATVYSITVKHRDTGGKGDDIIREFLNANGRTLIVAHRGNWLNGLPENGLDSIRESIDEGVDMVELDIRTTRDGVPVLMHDSNVNRTTTGRGEVRSLTLAQLKQLCLKNSDGSITSPCETIPTLEEAMALARGNIMVNLDIKDANWDIMWDILVRTDTTDHALYKTSASKASTATWMAQFKDSAVQPLFMQLTSDPAVAYDFMNPNTTPFTVNAFEVSFADDDAAVMNPAFIADMHRLGARIWVNTIFSVPGLAGRHGDYAFLTDPNAGFPWLLNRGVDMLQTDTTALLIKYLKERGNTDSSEVTQTVVLQQGINGYEGTADTQVVELPENNNHIHNFGGNAQVKIGPQKLALPLMAGNVTSKIASLTTLGSSPANEGKNNLIDSSLQSKWLTGQPTSIITFVMKEPTVVRGYAISSANDSPARDPQDWKFEGSHNGSNWVVLDTRTSQSFSERFLTKTYQGFTNDTAYSQYRLNITANSGEVNLQIAEIQLSDGSMTAPEEPENKDHRYGLLKFDLSSIPSDAKVISAKLGLYLVETGSANGSLANDIAVHKVTSPWIQGKGIGENGSAIPNGQNWVNWVTKPSFDAAPFAIFPTGMELYKWKYFDITNMAKGWQEEHSSNYGLLLNNEKRAVSFASSEHSVKGWRPKLEVTYSIPVAGLSVSPSVLSLEAGESSKLHAVVTPDNGLNREVFWKSENEAVARVDRTGLVTATRKGTTTIVATTAEGGHTASIPVTVTRSGADAYLSDLKLNAGSLIGDFHPETTEYNADVPEVYNHLAITPFAEDEDAVVTISVNGGQPVRAVSGQQSDSFPLEIGNNVIIVNISTNDGSYVKSYKINVPKAAFAFQEGIDGYTGTADTQLSKGTGGSGTKYYQYNLGAQYGFEVGYYNQTIDDEKYGLVRFDNLPIPEGAIISEASLNLYHYAQRSTARARDVFAHQANAPWVEGRGGSGNSNDGSMASPGEVTWENYITNNTNPFNPLASGQTNISGVPQWYAFEITDMVRNWTDAPETNYGVVLKPQSYPNSNDPTMTGTKRFYTKDYTDSQLRPYLRVVYMMPVTGIELDQSEMALKLGGSGGKLTAFVKPLNAVDKSVTWSSDNEEVAVVDQSGFVTAIAEGAATITATNVNGQTAHAVITVQKPGTEAELHGLELSNGQLSSALTAGQYKYDAIIPISMNELSLTPTTEPGTKIIVSSGNGAEQQVESGTRSLPIAIQNGMDITIVITSEDGQTVRTYTITIIKKSGLIGLQLSIGNLSPAFSTDQLQYTVNVPSSTNDIMLEPYAIDSAETIRISSPDGQEQTISSGNRSNPIKLKSGANILWLETNAFNRADSRTYTIVIHREAAANSGSGSYGSGSSGSGSTPTDATGETIKLGDELVVNIPHEDAGNKWTLKKLPQETNIAPYDLLSAVYSITAEKNKKSSKPLTISLAFNYSKVKEGRASVFRFDESVNQWIELGGYVQDGIITIATNSIGKFAVYLVDREREHEREEPVATWPDVRNHWAASIIAKAAEKGILTGYSDGTMQPNRQITRVQFAAMLVRARGFNETLNAGNYKDQSEIPTWAEGIIGAAVDNGIIFGYSDGSIRPNQPINRAEMITMLMRAFDIKLDHQEQSGFKDATAIPEWSKASVFKAEQLNIIAGNQGVFKPTGAATRAEAAAVITRMLEVLDTSK